MTRSSPKAAWLWSDLHLEFAEQRAAFAVLPVPPPGDLIILAGDIADGVHGVQWATTSFPDHPVAYVLGNHEAYHADLDITLDACRAAAEGTTVRILERDAWDVAPGFRILGATLWTDYALWGEDHINEAYVAALRLADHHVITVAGRRFTPSDARQRHLATRAWLEAELSRAATEGMQVVVVTHHAPHVACIPPEFAQARASLSAAFASDLSNLLEGPTAPAVWASGHTHHNHDGTVGRTRLVSNQAGYRTSSEGDRFRLEGKLVMTLATAGPR